MQNEKNGLPEQIEPLKKVQVNKLLMDIIIVSYIHCKDGKKR